MTAAASTTAASSLAGRIAVMPRWLWSVAALLVIAIHQLALRGPRLTAYLGDSDDAARLVQVREFMAGAPWFDTTTATMGGTDGMLSHWSRLIDLPLAAIIKIVSLFSSVETAELVARVVWPLMVLAPLLYVIQRTVSARSGEQAARIALALAILLPLGLYQFTVGRIDHHNVMVAATVSAALLMWANFQSRDAWALAGGLTGLALVIGYEALLPAVALAVLAALCGLFDRRQARPAQGFVIAMAAALAIGFFLTIPPSRWMDIRCDAISLNLVVLSAIAGAALCVAVRPGAPWATLTRIAIAAAGAIAGLIVHGGLEPKCLAGPMGQLPAELKPIWIDYVAETRSIARDLLAGKIEQSLGLISFFALGIWAQASRLRTSRSLPDLFFLCAVIAFIAFACWQYKYIAYASFIALVPIACWISTLRGNATVRTPSLQFMAAILLSQSTLLGTSSLIQTATTGSAVTTPSKSLTADAEECAVNSAVRELNALPAGRIAAHIDVGAYVIAETPHSVLSAPYHRIADAIIANHHIFAARTPDEARKIIAREQVDYVMTCKGLDDPFIDSDEWKGTLRADLVHGIAPDFLQRVTMPNPKTLYSVWRVDKSKVNPLP